MGEAWEKHLKIMKTNHGKVMEHMELSEVIMDGMIVGDDKYESGQNLNHKIQPTRLIYLLIGDLGGT